MGNSFPTEVRFGRRAVPSAQTRAVRVEDIRRGVVALNTLSRGDRAEPLARASCLYYALRSYTGGAPIDPLVTAVNARVAAFEWLVATRPRLFGRGDVSAGVETAAYEIVATEPLVETIEGPRFDADKFADRLSNLLAPSVGASWSPLGAEGDNSEFRVARTG